MLHKLGIIKRQLFFIEVMVKNARNSGAIYALLPAFLLSDVF